MKDKFENLMQKARLQGGLAPEEKKRLRINLEAVVLNNPVTKPTLSGWTVLIRQHVFVSALAVIFLFVGTGSALAEGALPGDLLYKFKTGINEQIRGWLAFSGEAKSEWQLSLAERRLKEIEILAENEELTSEEEVRLVEKVDSYTSAVLGNKVAMKSDLKEESSASADLSRSASLKTADTFSVEEGATLMMATGLPENIGIEDKMRLSLSLDDIKSLRTLLFEKKNELFKLRKAKDKGEYLKLKASILSVERQLISATISLKRGDLEKAQAAFDRANETLSSLSEEEKVFEGETNSDQSINLESENQVEVNVENNEPNEDKEASQENENRENSQDEIRLPVGVDVNLGL